MVVRTNAYVRPPSSRLRLYAVLSDYIRPFCNFIPLTVDARLRPPYDAGIGVGTDPQARPAKDKKTAG